MIHKYFKYFLSISFLILSLNSQLFAHTGLENKTSSSLFGDDGLKYSVQDEFQTSNLLEESHFLRLVNKDNLQLFFELIEDDKFDEEIVIVKVDNHIDYHFYANYLSVLGKDLERFVRIFPTHSNIEIATNSWYILFRVFRI